eukprot:8280079-Lingulodinium_polyedra.AAC.1
MGMVGHEPQLGHCVAQGWQHALALQCPSREMGTADQPGPTAGGTWLATHEGPVGGLEGCQSQG